jgi:acyl dehydratase
VPISTRAVGARLEARDVDLDQRRLLSFAAGIGIDWLELLDDARAEGVATFPTYCASLEFNALQEGLAGGEDFLGAGPAERSRGVHVGQDSFFHAPLRPGDRVTTAATIAAIRPTSAGALMVVRAETRRRDSAELLTTSWITQLFRGVATMGEPRVSAAPPPPPDSSPLGEAVRRIEVPVTRLSPHIYAECADIWNPIHSERRVALAAGLPDIIYQGTAVWSLAARVAVDALCDRDPGRLARVGTRFATMVLPGDTLKIEVFAPQGGVAALSIVNQAGEPVLKNAFAVIRR